MTKEAVGSATEKLEKFEEQNRRILDQNKDFDQRFAGAVAGGAVAPGDEKSRAKKKSKFDGLVSQGVPEDLAFDISTGQKGLSKSQKDFFESNSFRGQRGQIAEDLERGTLTTDQIEAIAKQLNLETEDVEARVKDARTLIGGGEIEAGLFADFKDFLSGADKGAELEAEAREVLGAVGKASVTLERDRESGADFNKLGTGTFINEGIDATRELAAFVKEAGADLVEGAKMSLQSSRKVAALMERGAKSSSEAADRTARQVVQTAPTQPADLAETT
ncbi:MAG TPA: hypothetical protein ENI79_06380 [Rhodospirillales bacterium]|nr:hypothetical protein [Rhodospirillales bacterium]